MSEVKHTPGPWEYIPSTEHHGAYVSGPYGDICDCYVLSNPNAASVRNGGESYPVPFQGESMDANARLIAAAPEMMDALRYVETRCVSEAAYEHACIEDRKMRDMVVAALSKAGASS